MSATHPENCAMPEQYPISVYFAVDDVKKSIKFYREKLGFELRNCWPSEKKPVWASLVLGGQVVMLGAIPTSEMAKETGASKEVAERWKKDRKAFSKHPHGVGVTVYVLVPEVDAYFKACRKKRVTVVASLETHFYGLRDFMIEDPDGYRLVFYSSVAAEASACEEGATAEVVSAGAAPVV